MDKPIEKVEVRRNDAEFAGYDALLREVKARVQAAQMRAALAVNSELVLLYWNVGCEIAQRMQTHGWGAKVVDRLSSDLRREFPASQGFSPRNLRYMRSLAEAWPDPLILQETLAKLTWYHNIALLEKLSSSDERLWYARQTIENGWSRNVLVHQIESGLCHVWGGTCNVCSSKYSHSSPATKQRTRKRVRKH